MAGGSLANRRSEAFLADIEFALEKQGGLMPYPLQPSRSDPLGFINAAHHVAFMNQPGWFCRSVSLGKKTIYGSKLTADFVFCHRNWARTPVALWGKCQGSSGSVDHKLPYLFENVERSPVPAVLVLSGIGLAHSDRVVDYARSKAKMPGSNVLRIFFTIDELRDWCVGGLVELPPASDGLFSGSKS